MRDTAIRIEGLGKQRRIGAKAEPYYSLGESLMKAVKAPLISIWNTSGRVCEWAGAGDSSARRGLTRTDPEIRLDLVTGSKGHENGGR